MKYSMLNFLIFSIAYPLILFAKGPTLENEKENKQIEEKNEKQHNSDGEPIDGEEKRARESTQIAENSDVNKSNGTEGKQTQKGAQEAEQTLKVGNLAFPPSQQPGPLVSFGQNIINKKQAQAQLSASEFKGQKQYFININPAILYAFTDSLSLFLAVPFAARYRQGCHHSSGFEDVIIQLEYAFYTKAHRTYYDQATLVASVTIPTGSIKKNPPTGLGANSFFIGGTYSRMEVNWFYFVSSGALATASSHRTRFGNQFLYQLGFGRRIANTKEWLFDWMVEIDGVYYWKNIINNKIDPKSNFSKRLVHSHLYLKRKKGIIWTSLSQAKTANSRGRIG
jgi:hypothetical protein